MKLKTLGKKIRRLETRLKEGPKKLAKLKRKFEALVKATAAEAKRKLVARAAATRRATKTPTTIPKTKPRPAAKPAVPQSAAKTPRAPVKVKRKLNLSPERRAQLAAAMKARWAAKRAATETHSEDPSTNRDFSLGSQPPPGS